MPSPFPGMDPYLDARWSNVHVLMMAAISNALNGSLPSGLEARPEEDVRVEEVVGERARGFRPDVAVIDTGVVVATTLAAPSAVATRPIELTYHRGPIVVRDVQIVDVRDGNRVVTLIEVLSPWNKLAGQLNHEYRRKLDRAEDAGANWVEIDLLRSHRRRMKVTLDDLPAGCRADYLATRYRGDTGQLSAYPISIRDRLPRIEIPLREGDADASLDLQAVLTRVYDEGPFRSLNYTRPPDPPLSDGDAAWAAELLRSRAG